MKINDVATWTNEQQPQSKKQNSDDFGHWLGEADDWGKQLMSPTQQSSGDEYYWQHQSQLQQSSLHFDALPREDQQAPAIIANTKTAAFADVAQHESTAPVKIQPQVNAPCPNRENRAAGTTKLAPIIYELNQALEQPTPPQNTSGKQQTTATNKQDEHIPWVNESLDRRIQFKNNHLFIQGAQAELSLNLHSFNQQEQKELIQVVKNHLKNKGLTLSRLIINGVNND